jgi:peptidoglycan/xylan/chitin deacetylase (PgdA/CDA1 family)
MRAVVIVIAALTTLGLAAFGVVAAQKAAAPSSATTTARNVTPPRTAANPVASPGPATTVQASIAGPSVVASAPVLASTPPTRLAENRPAQNGSGPTVANASPSAAPATANGIPACDKPDGLGLARIVEIDTTGGPAFGFEHFKQYDFLREHEVVLTFDDGPWPGNTPAVLKALTDNCLKATFFEIGEHAMWHPEITKMVIEGGNTVGSHTWSHKDLARNPYASDIEQAQQEIEMGVSAVTMAAGGPVAPFFRFPDLQQPPPLLAYLATRNISTFSTDIDSFDFKMHHPEQVIQSVMTKLKKHGKGILLMHDFQHATAEALPELLHQLKLAGFKVVHLVPRAPVTTVAKYDELVRQQDKFAVTNTRPATSVIRTISGD